MPSKDQNNRGGGNRGRRSNNNNPEGHNQYNSGWMGTARDRPLAAATAAAAAVGAGVFVWSKRNQISDQLSQISEQIGEWSENMSRSDESREFELAGAESEFGSSSGSGPSGEFARSPGTTGGPRRPTPRASKPTGDVRPGETVGSGTMSGGSLDTGPSGRGRA